MTFFKKLKSAMSGICKRRLTVEEALGEASGHNAVISLDRQKLRKKISSVLPDGAIDLENFARAKVVIADEINDAASRLGIKQDRTKDIKEKFLEHNIFAFSICDATMDVSPVVIRAGDESSGLLVIDNAETKFVPSRFDKNFAAQLCGYIGLDEKLGEDFTYKVSIFNLLHEYAHIGDQDTFLFTQDLAEKKIKGSKFADYRRLKKMAFERHADLTAAGLHYRVFKDINFLETMTHIRSLNILSGGLQHATAFELATLVGKLGPRKPKMPYVPPDKIIEAYNGLGKTLGLEFPDPNKEQSEKKDFDFTEKIVFFKEALKIGRIKDPHQKALAELCVISYDHIEKIMHGDDLSLLKKGQLRKPSQRYSQCALC